MINEPAIYNYNKVSRLSPGVSVKMSTISSTINYDSIQKERSEFHADINFNQLLL